jgi:hypothetical protein
MAVSRFCCKRPDGSRTHSPKAARGWLPRETPKRKRRTALGPGRGGPPRVSPGLDIQPRPRQAAVARWLFSAVAQPSAVLEPSSENPEIPSCRRLERASDVLIRRSA